MGLSPFLKIPTNQDGLGNDAVEGGIIVPFSMDLPLGFSLGAMTEFDFSQNANTHGYHPEFVNSLTLGHTIVGRLEGYVEFFSVVSADKSADWVGTFDVGLAYGLTPNMRLDLGVNVGVTESADDLNPFAGFSIRF